MMNPLLKVDALHTHIGQYHILQGISFEASVGEVSVLLGRNGAGKTTTLKTIMGLHLLQAELSLLKGRT